MMVMSQLQILYEDNHLLAINKPADLPTMGAASGRPSMIEAARDDLKRRYHKPGNVYLGVVSRLDAPVTGVVVLARTSKAAARLSQAFRERHVEKHYWALVPSGQVGPDRLVRHYLHKSEVRRRMLVCRPEHPDAQLAELRLRRRGELHGQTWLEIELLTGRKHQIRVQLEAIGLPVIGDRRYGSRQSFVRGIALHSRSLRFVHPVRGTPLEIVAPLPSYWPTLPRPPQESADR
jgi:23S rRNA pseudouridine1911/1915/1917 synthase